MKEVESMIITLKTILVLSAVLLSMNGACACFPMTHWLSRLIALVGWIAWGCIVKLRAARLVGSCASVRR